MNGFSYSHNNNLPIKYLKSWLSLLNHGVNEFFRVCCMWHVINLIVQASFEDIKEIIFKIRYSCLFTKNLQKRINVKIDLYKKKKLSKYLIQNHKRFLKILNMMECYILLFMLLLSMEICWCIYCCIYQIKSWLQIDNCRTCLNTI